MPEDALQEILNEIQGFLEKLINENKDTLNKDNYFEVKTPIAYGTFRLGWIEGSYNESEFINSIKECVKLCRVCPM